ncbi:MAG: site-specific tyrosine recombinase XerD [Flavobacteriales bacterium]|jgi:integrase/recombinase XerD|tara:strand:- start:8365 stop:9258 length:894 start_codon:yes stop_codon:yes gene_type:complete
MSWENSIKEFKYYLRVERSLSKNTIEAYIRDLNKFSKFSKKNNLSVNVITRENIQDFISLLNDENISARTQARIISSLKSFFKFLIMEDYIIINPCQLIQNPKIGFKLPDVLSIEEIDLIVTSIDNSTKHGQRNKTIIETLYSCGLRVSELINLKISNIKFLEKYIKIIGKGSKERLTPISSKCLKLLFIYINEIRTLKKIKLGNEDIVFLNNRGSQLSREMIFTIVKNLVSNCGINKNVSPHTFRHSFATHLIEGGADLRAVQIMLGHENITTTEIYTHLDNDYLRSNLMQFHPRS